MAHKTIPLESFTMFYMASGESCQKCRSDLIYDTDHKNPKAFCVYCNYKKLEKQLEQAQNKIRKLEEFIDAT